MNSEFLQHIVWLEREHRATMDNKAERLSFIENKYGVVEDYRLFHGGEISRAVFEELRWSFVNGQYIACVLLSQCFVEDSIRGLIAQAALVDNKRVEISGFFDLINIALEEGLISQSEAEKFHWLRKTRVQYVHPKPAFSKNSFAHRFINEEKYPKQIYEEDATNAVSIVLRLIQRPPFRY